MIDNVCDDQFLEVGVEKLCFFVDRVVGGDLICRSRLNIILPDFGHILEFQHVERTDKSDFYFYCHEINLLPLEDL